MTETKEIFGGGTAGCVLARRLSDDSRYNVLLIEAGGAADDPFIPSLRTYLTAAYNWKTDWGFTTLPQKNSPTNKTIYAAQGKMLGGCSAINGMYYTRGSRHDFNRWSDLGNKGWSYDEVLTYFKKSEGMVHPDLQNNGYHGTSGEMRVDEVETVPVIDEVINAAQALGTKYNNDYHADEQLGVTRLQQSVDNSGRRSSTYDAFIKPVLGRRNLFIITNAQVTKIKIDRIYNSNKAIGVYYEKDGKKHYEKALKEIIITAGAINTPKLLMLSGIGNRQHLEDMKIDVYADLPVGDNLQDHMVVPYNIFISPNSSVPRLKKLTFRSLFEYVFSGTGLWAETPATLIYREGHTRPQTDKFPYIEHSIYPDNLLLVIYHPELVASVRDRSGVLQEHADKLQAVEDGPIHIFDAIIHLHPRSRGTVRLRSNLPTDSPVIDLPYIDHVDDIRDQINELKYMQELTDTDLMKDILVEPTQHDPNCQQEVFDSDAYWECYVRHHFDTALHYTSTCKMDPDKRKGVVDNKLRVYDVSGLRLADSSVMPFITSGHPMAATIMIAEKAADMIKQDNKYYYGR